MKTPNRWSEDNLLSIASIVGKTSVKTQYACEVIGVSDDGRFVNVIHNTLEWEACADGDTIMINEFGKDVLCSPTKPWVIADVPVEETYERGQWKVRVRPKIGDRGILSVFYHDIRSLKEKGGFQAPEAIRVMAIDSASFRPGLPNHADVNAESDTYPSDDEWELKGNGVKVKLTSPADSDSDSPNKMEVNVGSVSFTINVPKEGDPTISFDMSSGAMSINAPSITLNGDVSITKTLSVTDAVTASSTITATGEITGNGIALSAHTHPVTTATAVVATSINPTTPAIAAVTDAPTPGA